MRLAYLKMSWSTDCPKIVIPTRPSFALVISPFLREDKLYFSNFYLLADKQWQNLGGEGSLRVFSC